MDDQSNGTDGQPGRDRVGLIGGVAELPAHVFSVIARAFTH
ncbi:MAG: hypothetical protein JWN68_1465 [Nocardioides sp.]|jgi:hypothetical protein|nr:hypothetical protein [Nocardioides sp.]MCW2833512.1 hypothetical protein [Nocardioides sp.]